LADENPQLAALRRRLEEEEAAYAECLAALDALASFPLPLETLEDLPGQMQRLNALWPRVPRPRGSGLGAALQQRAFDAVAPALDRQADFNSTLVQALNGQLEETARLHARLRDLVAALIRYLQRVQPLVDARDRMASALATARAELILESFDRRLESLGRRVEGLRALQDAVVALGERMRALEGATPRASGDARARAAAADDAVYSAFERRFRGEPEDVQRRLAGYVECFAGQAPVADLGCGRGEFLDALRARGIAAVGVDGNAQFVRDCAERGLDVVRGDLLEFLRERPDGGFGGVFAAQVAEHLPPRLLAELLREAHRALRRGGLLVLETVNPRSVFGLLEAFHRDLTHEKPLHPETLSFLAAAHGFTDVRVELRSPPPADMKLRQLPDGALPAEVAGVLNENVRRLNDLLYGPQDYALFARR
jgi:O-antigen chain-terminating methyltransferase